MLYLLWDIYSFWRPISSLNQSARNDSDLSLDADSVRTHAARMSLCISLTRRDAARNIARYYLIEVAPDLFGGAVLIRRWGRISTGIRRNSVGHGQERRQWFADPARARAAERTIALDIAPEG